MVLTVGALDGTDATAAPSGSSLTQPSGGPAAIFVNEAAGSAGSARVARAIEYTRRRLDADLHVTSTRHPPVLAEWLRERLAGNGYRTVVIAGGDGSLSVGYNVAGPDVAVGYIPAGFGNATAHLLRLPRDPDALSGVIAAGDARPVDLVAVDGRLGLFAGAGWDALVAGRYAASGARRFPGWLTAVSRSLPALWQRPDVEVRADGWLVHRGPMELMVVGTTPFYGRGLRVNPGARPDAGLMSARVYGGPAASLASEAVRWALRLRPSAPVVHAARVELRATDGRPVPVQVDGDLVDERERWEFLLRPAAVRLIGRWRD